MTTAHRATWKAARGGLQEEGSFRLHAPSAAVSGKDAPTEQKLKLRTQLEPNSREELRQQLQPSSLPQRKRPRKSRFGPAEKIENGDLSAKQGKFLSTEDERDDGIGKPVSSGSSQNGDSTTRNLQALDEPDGAALAKNENLKDPSSGDESGSDSDSDDDDDEADLLAELENVRKEREYERAKEHAEEQERQEQKETPRELDGNPLLQIPSNLHDEISDTASIATGSLPAFAVRRRWDDDVIFRSEAKPSSSNEPRFINDTIRNDFHKKFMRRHIR